MAETPINLNRIRKQRAQDARRQAADENAATFGRSKAQKTQERLLAERAEATLDAHRRQDDTP